MSSWESYLILMSYLVKVVEGARYSRLSLEGAISLAGHGPPACKGVSAAWIPGPRVKPTLWKEEAIDIWAVLSLVNVAAAMYDLTEAIFPTKGGEGHYKTSISISDALVSCCTTPHWPWSNFQHYYTAIQLLEGEQNAQKWTWMQKSRMEQEDISEVLQGVQ